MGTPINQKPCVVETPQGFSVSYNNRFLYSKYAPSKLIVNKINGLEILTGTIFICNSPALCYGLPELLQKLPENCLVFLCEFDNNLHNLTEESPIYNSVKNNESLFFPSVKDLYDLPIEIYNMASSGQYRRVISIDFSSGTQFIPDLYKKLEDACVNSVKTFWTNRLTLTKFGRQYSRNFFTNLKKLGNTTPINCYFNSVTKPVLIFGAGQSVDLFFNKYNSRNINWNDYFILCVDTILSSLISRNIIPDGVFVEEAQSIISKAFICRKYNVQLFTGLSSLPLLSQYFENSNISYFTTEYTKASFIDRLSHKGLLPSINSPFGSVGLTTVYYGLKFRKDNSIPVFVTGLDFSYSTGYTHGKGTLAHKTRLINNNKLNPIENYGAAFSPSSVKIIDKAGNIFITTPTLAGYGNLFNNMFGREKNLYDVSECGMKLSIPIINLINLTSIQNTNNNNKTNNKTEIKKSSFSKDFINDINKFLSDEKNDLLKLRSLLTEESSLAPEELKNEITKFAFEREYLYLHFPDGYTFQYNQSFLNRIRTEIDFFLKIFD